MVEIDKGVAGPEAFAQFVAANNLAWLFKKNRQDLKGLFGQLDAQTMLAQFEGFEVKVEYTAADYF